MWVQSIVAVIIAVIAEKTSNVERSPGAIILFVTSVNAWGCVENFGNITIIYFF